MELRLKNWFDIVAAHACFSRNIDARLVRVRRQNTNDWLLLTLSLVVEVFSDSSRGCRTVTLRHAVVHQDKFVHGQIDISYSVLHKFDRLASVITIVTL